MRPAVCRQFTVDLVPSKMLPTAGQEDEFHAINEFLGATFFLVCLKLEGIWFGTVKRDKNVGQGPQHSQLDCDF